MSPKTVLITGCSSGIGYDAAVTLQQRGHTVIATARQTQDVEQLRKEGLTSFQLDLADSNSIRSGFEQTLEHTGGRLDVLFNNGAYAQPGAVEDLSRDVLRKQFETNLFGWHELTNLVIPVMRKQGSGRILQNSSILGFIALKHRGAYVASKFALEGLTDTLRLELEGTGIHLALIEPGPITSKIRVNSIPHFERWIDWKASPRAAQYEASLLKRLYKEPGGGITPAHADQYYWPLASDRTITAWVPLQPVPVEMGPLGFYARSQSVAFGRDLGISDESEDKISANMWR